MYRRTTSMNRSRLVFTIVMFILAFFVISLRLIDVTIFKYISIKNDSNNQSKIIRRADILDRNGTLLATSLPLVSLYANPHQIDDKTKVAQKIKHILKDININKLLEKLKEDKSFVYLHRNLLPHQEYEINALGIPGLYFENAEKRIYPQNELVSHVIGLTDIDNKGIAGIEKTFENKLNSCRDPLHLSLDIRVQTILRNELIKTISEFHAIGAIGIVMDVHTGELLGMVSLPDFNPNNLTLATSDAMFNRASLGDYEMGSTFKIFNIAATLDAGTSTLTSKYDVTNKLKIAGFEISDYKQKNHPLTVPEILKFSSNIGSARMAIDLGIEKQIAFMSKIGMMRQTDIELSEVSSPLIPNPWRLINSMTISYGHGIAVSPLHVVTGISTLVNGGLLHPATLLKHEHNQSIKSQRVIKSETSKIMRDLIRMVVLEGTGRNASVLGYDVGGKTGTAEKVGIGGYHHKSLLTSFIAAFPMSDPKYAILAMIDEPKGNKESYGFATAGWTAAPAVGRIISQIGPLLGLIPSKMESFNTKETFHLQQN